MTDEVEKARQLVEGMDKALRTGETMPSVQGVYHLLKALVERVDRYEKDMPSWANGMPEDYDHWLRQLTPADRRLKFYQWIGEMAATEIIDVVTSYISEDAIPPEYRTQIPELVWEAISHVDPRQSGDRVPSALPKGKHMCDVQHHTHTDGMGYLPTCRLDSPE